MHLAVCDLGLFQTEMNMARNAIAILWCLCASRYIEEKKPLLYAANVLGAALFHQTALFFLILYLCPEYASPPEASNI